MFTVTVENRAIRIIFCMIELRLLTCEDEVGLDLEVCSIVERIPFQQTGDLVTYP